MIAKAEDREYAWRHAWRYAQPYVTRDQAKEYADYYLEAIKDEDVMSHWPDHSTLFCNWRNEIEDV